MANDAYNILGVPKGASDSDIKRAYRKLAAQHHPDKGGETSKFQEIQSAYETLSDPVKRQQHDNPNPFQGGPNGSHFEFQFGGGGPEDIFEQFFSRGFGRNPFQRNHQPRRNKDLRIHIEIDLVETLDEQIKKVSVQTTKGDRFTVDVTIPRGITHGTTIKYSGMGDNMFDTLTRGDLYVIINVKNNTAFEVRGIDLYQQMAIDSIDAMLGCEKVIKGLDGKEFKIKIPPGCQFGTKFGMGGNGLYHMNTNHRGNLVVEAVIKTPILNEEQLSILRKLKRDQ